MFLPAGWKPRARPGGFCLSRVPYGAVAKPFSDASVFWHTGMKRRSRRVPAQVDSEELLEKCGSLTLP
jgi:hypothetical protein